MNDRFGKIYFLESFYSKSNYFILTYDGSPYHPSRQTSQWKPVVACWHSMHSPVWASHVDACLLHWPIQKLKLYWYLYTNYRTLALVNFWYICACEFILTWFTIGEVPVSWFTFITSSTKCVFVAFALPSFFVAKII